MAIHESVRGDADPWGGHLRDLYAASLDEATVALDNPALGDAAKAWRGVATLWDGLADAALPADLDGATEAVEALRMLHEAHMSGESPGGSDGWISSSSRRARSAREPCTSTTAWRDRRPNRSAPWPVALPELASSVGGTPATPTVASRMRRYDRLGGERC